MSLQNCGHCKHFAVEPRNIKQGNCHRMPPGCVMVMTQNGPTNASFFPVVKYADFCGEYSQRFQLEQTKPDELPL